MATISQALAIALQHHQAGRLDMAEEIYRRILALEPNQPDAWHLLGLVAHQGGKHGIAVEHIGRAIELRGNEPDFHNSLGTAYRALGVLPNAVACYRRALELNPQYAEAHNNLGIALKQQGQLDEAAVCYGRALQLKPDYAHAHYNLGLALQQLGTLDEAIACYRRTLQLMPDFAEAHNSLGIALKQQGKADEAIACYRGAVALKPDYAEAYNSLGAALQEQGNLDEAVSWYRRAVALKPDYAEAHYNLGNALEILGEFGAVVACYQRALELKPELAEAHNSLGVALRNQWQLDEAVACYRRALALKPDYAEALNNLGDALRELGCPDDAVPCFRRALELEPDGVPALGNLLCSRQYQDGVTLAGLAEAHQEYEQRYAAPLRSFWREHDLVRDPERRLRLGFLSPDFGRHPVGFFLIAVLEDLARRQCEIVCYHDRIRHDELTDRFHAAASIWREVYGVPDDRLAEQIRADRIDILFDLAGHTAHNRLLVFARKPAPIQITWIGYVGTTGLAAMDYILADNCEIPPGAEKCYCERVLRLPDGYVCYAPPDYAPGVGPLPARAAGHVTFASFNNPAKITPKVVERWASILHRVSGARLLLKSRGLDSGDARRRYHTLFAEQGIAADRIELLGGSPHADLLASYGRADIALDTLPYSGGLTTCEALWMGVPVITCPGETFAGRHSLTHLSNVGLADEFVARDLSNYIELAIRWASDLDRLAAVRASLRARMTNSPLCDSKRFAANLMTLLRDAWRKWVSGT